MTTRDLISGSLRLLGVLASGEYPSAQEMEDGCAALNDMLASWALERLFVYSINRHDYTLTANKQTYTLGPGGDFNQDRPNAIDQAYVLYNTPGAQTATLPLAILTLDDWAAISIKSVTSTFPTQMYSDGDNPLSNVSFWPVPQQNTPIQLYTWQQFSVYGINDDIILPPGYARALRYNLAVELAPEYGIAITPAIASIATESKGNIKRINLPQYTMGCDLALVKNAGGWNWITGDYQT